MSAQYSIWAFLHKYRKQPARRAKKAAGGLFLFSD
jgi:hypothetical protein